MIDGASAIYLHIPFCLARCPYCDFATEALPELGAAERMRRYLRALTAEITRAEPRPASTVFFGGGTPTVLPAGALEALLATIADRHGLAGDAEITTEANPTSTEAARLAELRAAGFNRITFGVQSFDDRLLRAIGRQHSGAEALGAIDAARAAGFDNLNFDLMFRLPGQTLDDWERTLDQAVALRPEHLSIYSLTVEDGTPLAVDVRRGRTLLPDEDLDLAMFELAHDRLTDAGFEHYEVSNYARPGFACRHNLTYWYNEPYRGFGQSAAAYDPPRRRSNHRRLAAYLAAVEAGDEPVGESEELDSAGQRAETMFLGLRLLAGVDSARFARRHGGPPEAFFGPILERLVGAGWIEPSERGWRLTRRGLLVADRVFMEFV